MTRSGQSTAKTGRGSGNNSHHHQRSPMMSSRPQYEESAPSMMSVRPKNTHPNRPLPTHTNPMRPPMTRAPIPCVMPPRQAYLVPNQQRNYNRVPLDYSKIGPALVPDRYYRMKTYPDNFCDQKNATVYKKRINHKPQPAHKKAEHFERQKIRNYPTTPIIEIYSVRRLNCRTKRISRKERRIYL